MSQNSGVLGLRAPRPLRVPTKPFLRLHPLELWLYDISCLNLRYLVARAVIQQRPVVALPKVWAPVEIGRTTALQPRRIYSDTHTLTLHTGAGLAGSSM